MNLLDRRRFLVLSGVTAATISSVASADPDPFPLGVASGDPAHDSVILWTHVPGPATVRWEVSQDEGFRRVVRSGDVTSNPNAVHVTVDRLAPDRWYYYRFTTGGVTSRVGRTRTLPAPGADARHLRFAFASCQAWAGGPYPAYRDMAQQDLDFVVHLGDYIYETADGSLAEFRRLHALYKSSPDLRDAHARFPFFTTWDDHEVLNNWADDHKPSPDGRPFAERRANAFQAYYEHLPMRTAPVGGDWPIFRRFRWGRLAEFSVLDTRQYRDAQACGDGMNKPPCDDVFDPARTMTGPEQETWLLEGLRRSRARWTVLAQQTILARFDYDLGPGRSYNLDQWDGYPAARQRILDAIVHYRPRNPVVLAGDWHSHWVNDILANFDDPASPVIASEFAGTSISSGIGWDAAVRQGLPANPHVKLYNGSYRGYVMCDLTRDRWQSTLRVVVGQDVRTLAVFEVRDGVPGARQVAGGDGISGRVSTADGPLANAEVVVGSTRVWTDATGAYLAFVPPGTYTLDVYATGYESVRRSVTAGQQQDVVLTRTTAPYAGTGRRVPGPYAEAGPADVVLGNELIAMAVANGFEDPQLPGATRGKPVDLAAVGRLDQLDWLHLPYVSPTRPTGTEAWQRGLVVASTVEVAGTSVIVRAAGGGLEVATTYTVTSGQPWITATSVFTNHGETGTWWLGDAIDYDGPGQRSGVAGHGTIATPYGSPAAYLPTGRWIGMTGSDAQTYGLVYENAGFTAYGNGNWIQSQHEVTIPAGGEWTLTRRITALPTTTANPWTPLEAL
jgi:phosphodiesterase/alkaline phosphatase D-like protein